MENDMVSNLHVSDMTNAWLITDSQEIRGILENIGYIYPPEDIGCLFCVIGDAEIAEVYACLHTIPYLTYPVYKIY